MASTACGGNVYTVLAMAENDGYSQFPFQSRLLDARTTTT